MAVGSRRRGGEGVADGGHELVAHGDVERGIGAGDGVEGGGGANDAVVLEVEEVEFVALSRIGVPLVVEVSTKGDEGEETGAVAPVAGERNGGGSDDGGEVLELEGGLLSEQSGLCLRNGDAPAVTSSHGSGIEPRHDEARKFETEL